MRPESTFKIAPNWLCIGRLTVTHNSPTWRHPQLFLTCAVFLMSGLVTGPSFIAISLLGMELWQFSFIADWPKIWKLEILLSEFCPIFEDILDLVEYVLHYPCHHVIIKRKLKEERSLTMSNKVLPIEYNQVALTYLC